MSIRALNHKKVEYWYSYGLMKLQLLLGKLGIEFLKFQWHF